MQTAYDVPRVELPGLTEEDKAQIEAVHEEMDWYAVTKNRFLFALLRKGRPFTGKAKPRRKPTKHQRHQAQVKVRSAYLRERDDA